MGELMYILLFWITQMTLVVCKIGEFGKFKSIDWIIILSPIIIFVIIIPLFFILLSKLVALLES